jgi:hypothetical protein
MREAGFDHHRITRVGKLHCVVAYSNEKRQAG